MPEPFISVVRMFGFSFPPRSWFKCDGQLLPINQNQSLFSLIGTTYGGDGRTSFALPACVVVYLSTVRVAVSSVNTGV